MSTLRLRHIFTTTGTTLLAGGFSLLLTFLVARLLTPLQNGHYSQFSLIFNLYYIFMNFGIGAASTYFISSGKIAARRVAAVNVKMIAAIGLLSLLLGLLLAQGDFWPFVEENFKIPRKIFFLGLLAGYFLLVFNQGIAILLGKQHFDAVNLLNLLKASLPVLAILLAAPLIFDETGFSVATVFAMCAAGAVCIWYVFRVFSGDVSAPQKAGGAKTKAIFSYGCRVYVSNLFHYLAMRGLLMILSYYYAPEYVGFFSIGLVLLEALLVIPSAVGQLIFPQSSSANFNYELTDKVMRLNIYVGLLTIVGVILLASPVIGFLLGTKYQLVATVAIHLTPSILLLAVPRILSQVLSGRGHPEYPLIAACLSFFLGGLLAFWSIPAFGIAGAAWVTNLVSGVTALVTIYGYTSLRGVRIGEVFLPRRSDFTFIETAMRRFKDVK